MAYEDVKEYIAKLPTNPLTALEEGALDKAIFKATEDLSLYHSRHITARVITLQTLYNVESSSGEYEALKRQGIQSYSTKRGSISFNAGSSGSYSFISPQVIEIIGDPPASIGRFHS